MWILVRHTEVLKEEYYTLKAENLAQIAELRSRLNYASQSLEHYELIEAELDSSIIAAANGQQADTSPSGTRGTVDLHASMATSTKRRVQQALGLAQQLTDVKHENAALLVQLGVFGSSTPPPSRACDIAPT